MKELHFYIQSIMILLILALGLQEYIYHVIIVGFFLGVYQYGMSWFLLNKLRRASPLLLIYVLISNAFLISLLFLSLNKPEMNETFVAFYFFGVPSALAIFFVVVIEDLLWIRAERPSSS